MSEKIGIRVDGIVSVHLPDTTGNYATMCGLDGDDPNEQTRQEGVTISDSAKIDCVRCTAIWEVCGRYRASDFAPTRTDRRRRK